MFSGEVAKPIQITCQLVITAHGEGNFIDREIIFSRRGNTEHVLNKALGSVDRGRKISASRSPVAEHHVFASRAVKNLVGIGGRVDQGVIQLVHHFGRTHIEGPADENGMASVCGGGGHCHVAHSVVEVARKIDATAEENLVAKGEGGTFGVTLGQLDVGELPVVCGSVGIGIVEFVARQSAFHTANDSQDAVGTNGGVVINGIGQGGLGLPRAEGAVEVDGGAIYRILWSE